MLEKARSKHKADYLKSDKAKKLISQGKEPDPEQSWKSFKGKNLQRLLTDVLQDYLGPMGYSVTSDDNLEKARLDEESSAVMRNVLVMFGGYGVVPDADLIIYEKESRKVVAIVSAKVTFVRGSLKQPEPQVKG